MPASLIALRCRTSDRTEASTRGVDELAPRLAERLGVEPRLIGSPGEPGARTWEEDLRESKGCILEAGGQVDDALAAGKVPVLVAGDCSIAVTTLAAVARHRPDAYVLWLDAHGDFNTPETSPSGYLGGMALAGAVGEWDPGLGLEPFDPEQLALVGVRELDGVERETLERSKATVIGATIETLVFTLNAIDGAPVYVHADLDVLDPQEFPSVGFPAESGMPPAKLVDVLEAVAGECELVGLEITGFEAPADAGERASQAEIVLEALEPLLASAGA